MTMRVVAVLLVMLLGSSTAVAPASAQSVDPEQPSTVNPVLYFWGNEDITECWQHFDAEGSEGSAEDGYGEEIDGGDSQRLEVSITCEMRDDFKEDIFLNPNGKIMIEFGVRVDHAETEEEEDEDLSITLMKGNLEVAHKEFPDLTTDEDEQIIWELDVDENTTRWNSSGDEPRIKFEMSKPGWVAYGTPCDVALRCGGSFRLYYANNQDGMRSQIQFPIVDAPEVVEDEEPEEDGVIPGVGSLPGFGLLSGLGALALASAAMRTKSSDH
ncbi:MAG: hypothetical protein QF448_03275 [Candidatus Thalassarchaeaceae archaeon]|nr:hypothetical protein [Candidatus Thalassarchaeaceae archaeon]